MEMAAAAAITRRAIGRRLRPDPTAYAAIPPSRRPTVDTLKGQFKILV